MSQEIGRYGRGQMDLDAYEQAVAAGLFELTDRRASALRQLLTVQAEGHVWLAVHGYLCLALRHPGTEGPSAALITEFVVRLGEAAVQGGILTPEELQLHYHHEAEAAADVACERCGCTPASPCAQGCSWNTDYVEQGRSVCTRCVPVRRIITLDEA